MIKLKLFISYCGKDKVLSGAFNALMIYSLGLRPEEIRCTSVPASGLKVASKNDVLLKEVSNAELVIYLVTPNWKDAKFFQQELELGISKRNDRSIVFRCCGQDYEKESLPDVLKNINLKDANDSDNIREAVQTAAEILGVRQHREDHLYNCLVRLVRDISRECTFNFEISEAQKSRTDG